MESLIAARLLAEARQTEAGGRSRLAPLRDAIVVFRARGLSYERIAATLRKHGIEIHGSALGYFCRLHISNNEVERARREAAAGISKPRASPGPESQPKPGRIARDVF